MNFVAVDVGASNTRYTSDTGKINIIPNNMVIMEPGKYVDIEPYDGDIENALEVEITKDGESEYFPVKALIGQMATRYSSNNERPNPLKHKHIQQINYISIITAVALSKISYQLDDDINLYLALPPTEVSRYRDVIKDNFLGSYEVNFVKANGGTSVKFNIVDVSSYEESFLAMLSYFFEMNGRVRESSQTYLKGNVLSLDIGSSTTDIAIVKDGRYIEKSGQTYKVGGSVALDVLSDLIRTEYGFELSVQDAEMVMEEGRLQMGSDYVIVGELVDEAKKELSARIIESLKTYFTKVGESPNSIKTAITSGGGSMQSQFIDDNGVIQVTSEPITKYITDMLKGICKGIKADPHGESPRLANISGLFIRAKVDMNKKKATAQQNAQTVQQATEQAPDQAGTN